MSAGAITRPLGRARWRSLVSSKAVGIAIAGLVVVHVGAVAMEMNSAPARNVRGRLTGDVRRYHIIATHDGTPYRDFEVEFPPVSLGLVKLLEGVDVRTATVRLGWSQLVCDLLVAGALGFGWGRRAALAYLVLSLPFVVYGFVFLRLDLLSVALALWAFALLHRRADKSGALVLAAATFAKFWPMALAPILVVQRRWRTLVIYSVACVGGLVAWVAWGGTDGPGQVATFRGAKGWQIESFIGAFVRVVGNIKPHFQGGALRVGEAPTWASAALGVGAVAAIVVIWVYAARASHVPGVLDGLAPLTAVTALLLFSTLLSPQYACWLPPFAALAWITGWRRIAVLELAVSALSVQLGYWIIPVKNGGTLPLVVLFTRNALLLTLLVSGLVALRRAARPAASLAQISVHERVQERAVG